MSSFKCPFCGNTMSLSKGTYSEWYIDFHHITDRPIDLPRLKVEIHKCPNPDCQQESITASGENGYINNEKIAIYPRAIYRHFPDYIPQAIINDYQEASTIVNASPKAAATLARRCLQGMIHDFWNIHEKNLNAEISTLKGKIPSTQWNAIDALRKIGNIGAHMEHDTQLIVDVDPDEAQNLLRLIELLLDKWYVAQHDEAELYKSIIASAAAKDEARRS